MSSVTTGRAVAAFRLKRKNPQDRAPASVTATGSVLKN